MQGSNQVGRGRIVAVLSNPATTSGVRTLSRVELTRKILGFESAAITNIFALPTYRSGEISEAGSDVLGWHSARPIVSEAVKGADGILLAYGLQPPSGPAKRHFHDQIDWLRTQIQASQLPTWMLGGRPRHPSRWQRHTSSTFPELPFIQAVEVALEEVDASALVSHDWRGIRTNL
jgi:hypothetical protein